MKPFQVNMKLMRASGNRLHTIKALLVATLGE
jgi:ornithine carbamoyltransferase